MSGTIEGGRKAAAKNRERYGDDYYRRIGHKEGSKSTGGGFASNKIGKDGLTGPERAKLAGSIGGAKSRRGPIVPHLAKSGSAE